MNVRALLWPWAQDSQSSRSEGDLAETIHSKQTDGTAPSSQPSIFIVFFDSVPGQGTTEARAQSLLDSLGSDSQPSLIFDQLDGFAATLTNRQAQRLRALDGVKSVEADFTFFLEPPIPGSIDEAWNPWREEYFLNALNAYSNTSASSGETLPWGVQAVWQGIDISQRGNFASDTYAFIIDSGILNTTGDLNIASDIASNWHRSWVSGETPFTDGNGHGTHVAGTIAALANAVGVVGVAPGAQVVSLKVFDSSGAGASATSIIEAINHATSVINNNGLDKNKVVVNMSLGSSFSSSIDTAIRNAANQGIRFVVAAGNSGRDADGFSPASAGDHPNVFTISAVDSNYQMASFSNWDRITSTDQVDDVDLAAPGVSVLSYYRDGQLAYLSGTSMAAPHVAGLLLAGGVQGGDLVKPYYSSTADPFAWGLLPGSPGPAPEPTPEPVVNQILWGTTGNDMVTGGSGNDQLAGVPQTGTTAASLGRGQIDTLSGGAESDRFLLADSRGTFYNDGSSRSQGTSDYAQITDFNPNQDVLQLRSGSQYLYRYSASYTEIFLGNGDTRFTTADELIARLEGVNLTPGTGVYTVATNTSWASFV